MVYGKNNYHSGYGSLLIQECIDDAKKANRAGVAVIASKGTWMADQSIFLKNGFELLESKDRFDLLVYKLKETSNPAFINWENNLNKYIGLHLIYANQCPLFIKSVDEMKQTAKTYGLDLKVAVLKTAQEAQQSPSGYGTYSLVYNDKILSDHYISNTRFKNILNKEIKKD
ncbi:MAG: YoaP domain-containing protein [Bacteroidales bacterium]|nr:YoaP domain-containing protein [Bacteroidales bacterium]